MCRACGCDHAKFVLPTFALRGSEYCICCAVFDLFSSTHGKNFNQTSSDYRRDVQRTSSWSYHPEQQRFNANSNTNTHTGTMQFRHHFCNRGVVSRILVAGNIPLTSGTSIADRIPLLLTSFAASVVQWSQEVRGVRREAREIISFSCFCYVTKLQEYHCIAHSYGKNMIRKSTLEYTLNYSKT